MRDMGRFVLICVALWAYPGGVLGELLADGTDGTPASGVEKVVELVWQKKENLEDMLTQENTDQASSTGEGIDEESPANGGTVQVEDDSILPQENDNQENREYISVKSSVDSDEDKDKDEGEGEDVYNFERYRVPRKWSRPVEAVLEARSTLYDVMGVSPGASISDIKKTFRLRSLRIHPGLLLHDNDLLLLSSVVRSMLALTFRL
jgi:hypothetical protein